MSSGTLRSVIEYGLALPFYHETCQTCRSLSQHSELLSEQRCTAADKTTRFFEQLAHKLRRVTFPGSTPAEGYNLSDN